MLIPRFYFIFASIFCYNKERFSMCRSIKTLHNFAPPATDEEVPAAALQYVPKLSGSRTPSKINEAAFERAADSVKQLFWVL